MLSGKLPPGHAPRLFQASRRCVQDGLTQSQTGVQGALGLLCSGGRAHTAWVGLVSFFHFFKKISREDYVSSWDVNIIIAIKIRYIVQPYRRPPLLDSTIHFGFL